MKALPCVSLLLAPTLLWAQLSREVGAIYLEELLAPETQPILLKVVHPAPVYFDLGGRQKVGTLRVGYRAEVVGVSDRAYLVRARAKHATVKGWITPKALEDHDTQEFLRTIKELRARHVLVGDLIDNNQVALGMTQHEVIASLGKADRVNSTIDSEGKKDVLEYITYDRIPQYVTRYDYRGIPYQAITYVKVETGKVEIKLTDDLVTSISNTEGAPNLSGKVTIAPPPLILY